MNLNGLIELASAELLEQFNGLLQRHGILSRGLRKHGFHCFCWFDHLKVPLDLALYDLDSHASCCPFDHATSMFKIAGIEVRHFLIADIIDLGSRDLTHLGLVRFTRSTSDPSGHLE